MCSKKHPPIWPLISPKNGIWLAGGGALLKGLRILIYQAVGLEVRKSEDPLRSVIRGAGSVTEHFDYYRDVFVN